MKVLDRGRPVIPARRFDNRPVLAATVSNVRYVLIGGFAVILHGFVRATKDIDLLIDASVENVHRLKRAMAVLPDNAIALIAETNSRSIRS